MDLGAINTLRDESGVIAGAPWSALTWAIVALVAAFVVMRILKAKEIGDLNSRLQLRDDEIADYKRKLDGATPDQAQERIAQLEKRVAALTPTQRALTDEQKTTLAEAVKDIPYEERRGLSIIYPQSSLEAGLFADQIAGAFRDGGWVISAHQSLAPQRFRERGVNLALPDLAMKPVVATAVATGLENAGLAFNWIENPEMPAEGVLFVDMAEEAA